MSGGILSAQYSSIQTVFFLRTLSILRHKEQSGLVATMPVTHLYQTRRLEALNDDRVALTAAVLSKRQLSRRADIFYLSIANGDHRNINNGLKNLLINNLYLVLNIKLLRAVFFPYSL